MATARADGGVQRSQTPRPDRRGSGLLDPARLQAPAPTQIGAQLGRVLIVAPRSEPLVVAPLAAGLQRALLGDRRRIQPATVPVRPGPVPAQEP